MKETYSFIVAADLKKSMIAVLMEAGLELYEIEDQIIVLQPNEPLPKKFLAAKRLIKPTNVMGKWALSLTAKEIKKR